MTRKHFELEREFIGDLEGRTGRTLPGWMAVIDAAGVVGKNEIIDWLRPQGFTFAHASWLERIHNNSGRPIYSEPPMGTVRSPPLPGRRSLLPRLQLSLRARLLILLLHGPLRGRQPPCRQHRSIAGWKAWPRCWREEKRFVRWRSSCCGRSRALCRGSCSTRPAS